MIHVARSDSQGASNGRNEPPGHGTLRELAWDTAFFGARMGLLAWPGGPRLDSPPTPVEEIPHELSMLLARARWEGYAHLILRAAGEDCSLIWAAERAGLRL